MEDFEKTGIFYLGQNINPSNGKKSDELLLYASKNLTTHAVCLGMTGSGKTGLCITLLEEAGLDKIPAIIIDPKGDVSNLLLLFPELSAEQFRPWIDEQEAERKGITPDAYAAEVAKTWKEGLASSREKPERIKNLQEAIEMVIYTPGNNSGVPISILSSFEAPSKEELQNTSAIREQVSSLASSLLALVGIDADPIKSREHNLISTIIDHAWHNGENLGIATLIQLILKPPFSKIGALDLETFFPQKDRFELSIRLNNLLASPGFRAWMEGEPLDIKQLLHTKEGKPKFSIFSIAHLSDSERMFFVTLLLNEIISWMRRQPGTSSLRALLYMDEIFGYFPPVSAPPSKLPMLTLLKQARAYGLGVVLATQNPVDLDYKGLSNCGTWFIGKLQTSRDRARVTEGLRLASNGEVDSESLVRMLSNIAQRTFIMRSIYEKEPIVFSSRWALSYLRGPLTLSQIQLLTKKVPWNTDNMEQSDISKEKDSSSNKPIIPLEIPEFFINGEGPLKGGIYTGQVLGRGKLHFINSKYAIDVWQEICLLASPSDDGKAVLWDQGKDGSEFIATLTKTPLAESQFAELPGGMMQIKNFATFKKSFEQFLYQNHDFTIFQLPELNLFSKVDENEKDFRERMMLALRENRDERAQKFRSVYEEKISTITKKIKSIEEKISNKQHKTIWGIIETIISFCGSLLGALTGKGVTKGTITQAGSSLKRASKIGMGNQETAQAKETLEEYQQQLEELQEGMRKDIDALYTPQNIDNLKVEKIVITPRKSDILVEKVAIAWVLGN
ncbi:MAG: ATP-binding protein [Parachlamydiaceae bacterium]|nr:ATP-binding protein [Parachlamydiaceae bacterium]